MFIETVQRTKVVINMSGIKKLYPLTGAELRLFLAIIKNAKYSEEKRITVMLVKRTKRRIAKELGYERVGSIDNAIVKLAKAGLLIRLCNGYYEIDKEVVCGLKQ